jgi:glucose dehydrogenase
LRKATHDSCWPPPWRLVDIPAQPSLATITLDGKERDVVIQGTKQGLVFVLDRDTG